MVLPTDVFTMALQILQEWEGSKESAAAADLLDVSRPQIVAALPGKRWSHSRLLQRKLDHCRENKFPTKHTEMISYHVSWSWCETCPSDFKTVFA